GADTEKVGATGQFCCHDSSRWHLYHHTYRYVCGYGYVFIAQFVVNAFKKSACRHEFFDGCNHREHDMQFDAGVGGGKQERTQLLFEQHWMGEMNTNTTQTKRGVR